MPRPAVADRPVENSSPLLTWSVADFAAASDAELEQVLATRALRLGVVHRLLDGMANGGADWSGPCGVVRLEVGLPNAGNDDLLIEFATTGVRLVDAAEADVTLGIDLVPLVRLVTGQADGALLYLAEVLRISGDESLVVGLGGVLRAPGATGALVDPAALDPVAVSAAIDGVRTEHLAAVMAGGFRDLILDEVFARFPEFLIAEKAARITVAIGFRIGGRADGVVDRYVVRVVGGACVVTAHATQDDKVDATLILEGHEFLRLVLGHLNPVRGVLSGDIRVEGQLLKALGFNSVMRIPGS